MPCLPPSRPRPNAVVYVDGFNLFRRALQGHDDRKWLDLEQLCRRLLPTFDVRQIRYFTARVRHVEGKDPRAPQNQEAYLRALGTLQTVSLHFGTFRADKRWMAVSPLEFDETGEPKRVRVRKIEEKGTDVSLAAHMVCDAMDGIATCTSCCRTTRTSWTRCGSSGSGLVRRSGSSSRRALRRLGACSTSDRSTSVTSDLVRSSPASSRGVWLTAPAGSHVRRSGDVQKPLSEERGFAPVSHQGTPGGGSTVAHRAGPVN
ncbi:hypothetical protein [Curtobacterium sp. VKM Ac-1395]|uniref:hypothetical protein n=1 Tax=Curtobacterium sp. VKM Ac-1395 TaxID=2783815 RepID=UPI00188B62B6|nr:hypothetical protein [Curtobacterium sp. VKM Ac-1395]MBF4589041.1 hypothetical protein [Curtobacterium sp. VKM Ac-1395]